MKRICLLLLAGIPYLLPAQHVLQKELNTPRVGDQLVKEQFVFPDPGQAGENQSWDFSSLAPANDKEYRVDYFSRYGNEITTADNASLSRYKLSGDSLQLWGHEDPMTLVRLQQPGLLLKFPVTYQSSTGSGYYGRGKYCDRLAIAVRGTVSSLADALGTIILPGKDTVSNVVRVHIRKQETETLGPITDGFDIDRPLYPGSDSCEQLQDSLVKVTDTYQWYAEGYRYPVFETTETNTHLEGKVIHTEKKAFVYHPYEQAALAEDPGNEAVLKRLQEVKEATGIAAIPAIASLKCYPNPVSDRLEVEIPLNRPSQLQVNLYDLSGKLVYQSSQAEAEGNYRLTVGMGSFPKGNYLLKVQAGDESMNEKIVRQ